MKCFRNYVYLVLSLCVMLPTAAQNTLFLAGMESGFTESASLTSNFNDWHFDEPMQSRILTTLNPDSVGVDSLMTDSLQLNVRNIVAIDSAVTIRKSARLNETAIYIMPGESTIYIEFVDTIDYRIQVLDADGQLVSQLDATGQKTDMDLSYLHKGRYNIILSSGEETSKKSFVKMP
jgi:hypothetical protein